MNPVSRFDYTPTHQPVEGQTITVTLKPLTTDALWDIERTMIDGSPSWAAVSGAAMSIVGWSGEGVEEYSRETLRNMLKAPTLRQRMFFGEICGHLWSQAILKEDDQKKS